MSQPPSLVAVVGAALIDSGRCLAARRGPQGSEAGLWEFPGGKVEAGESPRDALIRELREELGIDAVVGSDPVGVGTALSGGRLIELTVFAGQIVAGDLILHEHAEVGWFTADELQGLAWAAADVPIVPRVCALLSRTNLA